MGNRFCGSSHKSKGTTIPSTQVNKKLGVKRGLSGTSMPDNKPRHRSGSVANSKREQEE